MAFGDNDLGVFFGDFGVPVTFGGVTVQGNLDTPLDSVNFGGGPSGIGRQQFSVTVPAGSFPRALRNGDRVTVSGLPYVVKARMLSIDGSIATYDLDLGLMPSVALQIELAMVAALGAADAPAGVRIDRGNTGEYTADVMPAYNVASMETAYEYGARESDRDSLAVRKTWGVFCYAAASGGIKAADAVDSMLVNAFKALSDNTLGGLARDLEVKGEKWNFDQKSGIDVVEVQITVEATFDIVRGDPSQNYDA